MVITHQTQIYTWGIEILVCYLQNVGKPTDSHKKNQVIYSNFGGFFIITNFCESFICFRVKI